MDKYIKRLKNIKYLKTAKTSKIPESKKGVIYVIYSAKYSEMAFKSIQSLRNWFVGEILIIADQQYSKLLNLNNIIFKIIKTDKSYREQSRSAKTQLYDLSIFEKTLFVDCDTIFYKNPNEIFNFNNISMALDTYPTLNRLRKRHKTELNYTRDVVPLNNNYYNSGVIFFPRNDIVANFFKVWHEEWQKFKNVDQLALARTIQKTQTFPTILNKCFNQKRKIDETVIWHYMGHK